MVRAKCSICTEAIRDKAGACPCGHVYHLDCLNRWLSPNRTCPTCRKSASKAIVLYFDVTDLDSSHQIDDPDVLENQIADLKDKLQQKDLDIRETKKHHKNELKEQKASLLKQKDLEIENVIQQYEKKLQLERSTIAGLKKQLVYLKDKEIELAVAQNEASELRSGYLQLKRMKTLIDDNTNEAESMLKDLDSKSFPEVIVQLVTMKKKLEEKRKRCKEAIDTTEQVKKENNKIKNELTNRQMELRKCKDNLQAAEEDISRLEKENASYQKKLTAMEMAFASPSPRSSAIGRLIRESPAPMDLKRPRLSPPTEDSENIIVAETPSPKSQRTEQEPRSELKSIAEEMGLSLVKTTSMTASYQRSALRPTQQYHQAKKPAAVSSVFKRGYDGLGGHGKFLVPPRPTKMAARKVARPAGISKFIKQTTWSKTEPPLPVMDLDFV